MRHSILQTIMAALLVIVVTACGEPESMPGGSTTNPTPSPDDAAVLITETVAASTPTAGAPTSTVELALPDDTVVQTADDAVTIARTAGIGETGTGRNGQPIEIVDTRLTRYGDIPQDSWARSDMSRRDQPGDIVWEVEMANLWLGHSCQMGSSPESCHWTDLVVVISATSGEVIGLRYSDWFLAD